MPEFIRKLIGQFAAYDEQGRSYTIKIGQRYVIDGLGTRAEGLPVLLLEGETEVNRVAKGRYHVPSLSLDLFSDDPAAP